MTIKQRLSLRDSRNHERNEADVEYVEYCEE